MEKSHLAALPLPVDEFFHKLSRGAAALKIGMSADSADFPQRAGLHSFTSHRDESRPVEKSEILAEFNRARPKWAGMRQLGEREGRSGVLWSKRDRVGCLVVHSSVRRPHHTEHRGLDFNLPTGGHRSGPVAAIEVFPRFAERDQRGEVRLIRLRKSENRRKPLCIASRPVGAGREMSLRTRQRAPDYIFEELRHGRSSAGKNVFGMDSGNERIIAGWNEAQLK